MEAPPSLGAQSQVVAWTSLPTSLQMPPSQVMPGKGRVSGRLLGAVGTTEADVRHGNSMWPQGGFH